MLVSLTEEERVAIRGAVALHVGSIDLADRILNKLEVPKTSPSGSGIRCFVVSIDPVVVKDADGHRHEPRVTMGNITLLGWYGTLSGDTWTADQ